MDFSRNIWLPIKRSWLTLVCVFILCYLLFHIIQGDRGLLSYPQRARTLDAKTLELAELKEKQMVWQRRVALLQREKGIDLDMLEERSRVMLNFTHPDEVVILKRPK